MVNYPPRILIAALKGGSGKTIMSLGLACAWRERGQRIAPFKKGPDFIDAHWLALAADRPCHNLDPFMMTGEQMIMSFAVNSDDADLALIEGNRGLFDGLDLEGRCSTAELAKLLHCPLALIVDVTMSTRTIAALVMGCQRFDEELGISGVILNRVAGSRQERLVRDSIERFCGIPVVGSVPKLKQNLFPERHMGLVPHQERAHSEKALKWARTNVEENIDLDALLGLARDAAPVKGPEELPEDGAGYAVTDDPPHIGFMLDSSFWFYYPENLDQLRKSGAIVNPVNAMTDRTVPDLDALYIGGGFPETQAQALADNRGFRESLREKIEGGLPVYAECGGLLYLGENLIVGDRSFPMVGSLPLDFVMEKKPQGHGYTVLEVTRENPYYAVGEVIRGHEFHYSRPAGYKAGGIDCAFTVRRGRGLDGRVDGLYKKNLLATYTHIHGAGNPLWAKNFFMAALEYRNLRKNNFSKPSQMRD